MKRPQQHLTKAEKAVLTKATNGDCSKITGDGSWSKGETSAWWGLHARKLIEKRPCHNESCSFVAHTYVTALGKLALELDEYEECDETE